MSRMVLHRGKAEAGVPAGPGVDVGAHQSGIEVGGEGCGYSKLNEFGLRDEHQTPYTKRFSFFTASGSGVSTMRTGATRQPVTGKPE